MLAETLRGLAGLRLRDEDGREQILELEPPATEAELEALEAALPCPIPDEIRAALRVSKRLANGPLESFSLIDLAGFGLDEAFPCAYSIAHDGYGNYWILDLIPDAASWGPVFYACHDPPVIAYQSATVEQFLHETIAMWRDGARSQVDVVHEDVVHRIWHDNAGLTPVAELGDSPDRLLRGFAATLGEASVVADLRAAQLGDGFSWGRFGPRTVVQRAGTERVWALTPPERKPGILRRLFSR
ncbi:MAG TPA: SMI1/KNR4 family protein [Gemmatimonadales bacterium]